jgi:acetolactate synthase I/II/III large subunit
MRVADYIFKYLADYGIKHVFMVSGGAAMHLNDALKNENRIQYVCTHHEQGAAIAAEGYARTTGNLAVVSVTSGPGGTNALTGVIGQWLDSVPVLYLSGQVKFETTLASVPGSGLRQLGDQEINIIDIVRPVTKYAKMIVDPTTIRAELEMAIKLAVSGRPGPVWLDLPLDVQGAPLDDAPMPALPTPLPRACPDDGQMCRVIEALQAAKRPLLIAGHGIRISRGKNQLHALLEALRIPVVTTFNGFDLVPADSDFFVGRIGTLGSLGGNFALQNADLVLCVGSRNNIRQVSYDWASFARGAKKVLVDTDPAELLKKTVPGEILIQSDAEAFLTRLLASLPAGFHADPRWLAWCRLQKEKHPVVLEEYRVPNSRCVHPYHFLERLTTAMKDDALVVCGNGSACVVMFQAGTVKSDQRIFWNSGCASMGFALPASIGAAFASGREVICVIGDGCLQMNLQELQTIRHHRLPIKLFILNNQGYRSIEQTQASFFGGDYIGCNAKSGVSFPDNAKLAHLYDMAFFRMNATASMDQVIAEVLASSGPTLCDVVLNNTYVFSPKLASVRRPDGRIVSKPLEAPCVLLDQDELASV